MGTMEKIRLALFVIRLIKELLTGTKDDQVLAEGVNGRLKPNKKNQVEAEDIGALRWMVELFKPSKKLELE